MTLHLLRCSIDVRRLHAFARRAGSSARELDDGYAVHALFAALFDHGAAADARVAPKPFALELRPGGPLRVLGYASLDRDGLIERARAFGDPVAWEACTVEASKPMPSTFAEGTRLGFSVRACPIRRIAKRGPMDRDRAEVDAFLARSWEVGQGVPLDRGEVYNAWLAEELGKDDAAELLASDVKSFRRTRLHRRTQGADRTGVSAERPDVLFEGTLAVRSPAGFMTRLARGLGRHRAFGFGMLLLRPPPRE